MDKNDQHTGGKPVKLFLAFAGLCLVALPFIVLSAMSYEPPVTEPAMVEIDTRDFDHSASVLFESYDRIHKDYIEGTSTERTLENYYSLRQYIGSPPCIPHKVNQKDLAKMECLACHAKGGWTDELKRHTPLTPHPEKEACTQCHVKMHEDNLFVAHDWISVMPPRLGRSHLPGAPSPIPHSLQMRENCIACHVGPGAVNAIRVDHPSRGNCRQCHVPDLFTGLFERPSSSE